MTFETDAETSERIIYGEELKKKPEDKLSDYEKAVLATENFLQGGLQAMTLGGAPESFADKQRKVIRRFYRLYKEPRVRELRQSRFQPVAIYTYVLRITEDGKVVADGYELHDDGNVISDSKMKEKVAELFADLQNANPSHKPVTRGFENVVWNKVSYLVFVLDSDSWKFAVDVESTKVDPLHFEEFEDDNNIKFGKNYSFFNGGDYSIGDKQVYYCHNFLIDKRGRQLKDKNDKDNYKFDLWFRVKVEGGAEDSDLTIIIDPTGQNQGPP